MAKLVLASSSPRRQELLEMLGLSFTVVPSNIEENNFDCLAADDMVKELARAKAEEVGELVEDALVIGSDTIVTLEGTILGKPADSSEAIMILKNLQNKEHTVLTGLAIYDTESGRVSVDYDKTQVFMGPISDEDIINYVQTGEPMDKAGAYGIQGIGGAFIESIKGSYYNVMGLPVHKLVNMLKDFGVSIF